MPLPEAVLEAEREAEAAEAALDALEDTDATSTLDELDTDDDDQTGEDTETQDADDDDEQSEFGYGGEEQGTVDGARSIDWEQRYKSINGKYNAEVPRLTRDLDYLRGQVEAMARTTSQQGSRLERDAGAPDANAGFKRHLKKGELEEYDEEILDFQSRLARGEAETVMSPVVSRLLHRIEQLEGRAANDEQDSLWSAIERVHPGAKEINDSDPVFVDFLNLTDGDSGRTYKEIGEAAYASGDVGRVASLFAAYVSSTGGGATASPNGNKRKAAPPVKPSRSSGGTVRTSPIEKPTLRESEINAFFSDVTKGKYAGRDKAMKKREAIIESAVLEGRVRPG